MEPFLPAPQPIRWRKGVYAASLVIPFTGMQIWALLVLLNIGQFDGPAGLAILLTLVGSVAAVCDGWRWTWQLGREQR